MNVNSKYIYEEWSWRKMGAFCSLRAAKKNHIIVTTFFIKQWRRIVKWVPIERFVIYGCLCFRCYSQVIECLYFVGNAFITEKGLFMLCSELFIVSVCLNICNVVHLENNWNYDVLDIESLKLPLEHLILRNKNIICIIR